MHRKISTILYIFLTFIILTQSAFADIGTNIDGGGGGLGQGSADNGWAVSGSGGGLHFDADGLRVYVVNSSTGRPVSRVIDFTNYTIARNNVFNGMI
jgi:hypothetical protein